MMAVLVFVGAAVYVLGWIEFPRALEKYPVFSNQYPEEPTR